jgi:hypothetical protein
LGKIEEESRLPVIALVVLNRDKA